MENVERPLITGVPLIVPVVVRVIALGSAPELTDHVYGGDPPEAASACEYTTPTVPAGSDDVVITNAGGLIVTDNAADAETDALSVTRTVKLLDPALPRVPDIVPPPARPKPAGNDPLATDHAYRAVPPQAPIVSEYPAPTLPAGATAAVIPTP